MTSSKKDLCDACPHVERPVSSFCMRCGKGSCYECSNEIVSKTSSKVVARVYVEGAGIAEDVRHSEVTVNFCPRCYLEEISRPNYRIITGINDVTNKELIIEPKKPRFFDRNGVSIFNHIFTLLFFVPLLFGFLFLNDNYQMAKKAYNNYLQNKQQAEWAIKEMKARGMAV